MNAFISTSTHKFSPVYNLIRYSEPSSPGALEDVTPKVPPKPLNESHRRHRYVSMGSLPQSQHEEEKDTSLNVSSKSIAVRLDDKAMTLLIINIGSSIQSSKSG